MAPKISICDDCIHSALIDWDTGTYWCEKYKKVCSTDMCGDYISCEFDNLEEEIR